MTRKIEEIVTLWYEEKEKREERKRGEKEEVETEELIEDEEEHGDDNWTYIKQS